MPRKQDEPQVDVVAVEYEEVIIIPESGEPDGSSSTMRQDQQPRGGAGSSRSSSSRRSASQRGGTEQAEYQGVDEDVEEAVAENNREEVERAHRKGPDTSRLRTHHGDRSRGGDRGGGTGKALLGLGLAAAGAGTAFFFAKKANEGRSHDRNDYTGPTISDAPDHVLRGKARETSRNNEEGKALVGRTVTIDKSRHELYAVWRDFTRFPEFMDNVREISKVDDQRSRWTIEAPMGATVQVVTRIVEDVPGETIAWVSEPDSQVETDGRVEFADAPPGRGTYVRLLIRYKPPAGTVGRMVAKVFQREPNVQARRDLRRFKQLMETGEVPVNASPSARKSESPTEATV